ncbi:hypothetical protein Tco_0819282 [Tanacetum coccineum]|uniref:Uncharacterized protein n=1 Tax=Tanacetum coccineum TaxID=301880 RepID=A0ABQ5AAD2_9ASTR
MLGDPNTAQQHMLGDPYSTGTKLAPATPAAARNAISQLPNFPGHIPSFKSLYNLSESLVRVCRQTQVANAGLQLSGTSVTHYYMNLNIPETLQIRQLYALNFNVKHTKASFIQEDTKGLFSPDICIVEMELKVPLLANFGAIHNTVLIFQKKLYVLSPDELRDLVCNKLKLVLKNDPWTERVDFLNEAMSTSRCHVSVATSIFLLELADKDYQLRGLLG